MTHAIAESTDSRRKLRGLQFTIAETMVLAAVVGSVLRWLPMIWVALPIIAFWLLRRRGVRQRVRWWVPGILIYALLIPFTWAPVMWIEDGMVVRWKIADHRYFALSAYRPVMKAIRDTPLYYPVWAWSKWVLPDWNWPTVQLPRGE